MARAANFDYRAFDQYAGILRLGYEIDPGLKPFVEVDEDTRVHDSPVDNFGEDRNSNGSSAKLGADLNLFGSLDRRNCGRIYGARLPRPDAAKYQRRDA